MDNKNIIYMVLLLIQAAVIIYLVRRRFARQQATNEPLPAIDPDSYDALRDLALSVTPAQLKLLIPDTQTLVYGVVMDCNLGNGIVTLTAYITGAVININGGLHMA